ncbi:MAG: hypothetical protein MJD61_04070, partial [Proteobacteria bacterium]|nr:hypothetical protein [Pseudomonadota bacterium]
MLATVVAAALTPSRGVDNEAANAAPVLEASADCIGAGKGCGVAGAGCADGSSGFTGHRTLVHDSRHERHWPQRPRSAQRTSPAAHTSSDSSSAPLQL